MTATPIRQTVSATVSSRASVTAPFPRSSRALARSRLTPLTLWLRRDARLPGHECLQPHENLLAVPPLDYGGFVPDLEAKE